MLGLVEQDGDKNERSSAIPQFECAERGLRATNACSFRSPVNHRRLGLLMMRLFRGFALVAAIAAGASVRTTSSPPDVPIPELSPLEQLGKSVFFDRRLSLRGNQSCASCHAPDVGWTGDLSAVNAGPAVYEGSVIGLFSNRKPPTVAYAMARPRMSPTITSRRRLPRMNAHAR
jgi:hypothetical protein